MTYMRMPMFCWTTLASNLLIVAAFPILTATLTMLVLDRYLGFHFFTNEAGGNMMMFVNLIWVWDIRRSTSLFCRLRRILGSGLHVLQQAAVRLPLDGRRDNGHLYTFFHVWLHHFFTMARRRRQRDLRYASMIIAYPRASRSSIGSSLCTAAGSSIRRRYCGRSALWSHS